MMLGDNRNSSAVSDNAGQPEYHVADYSFLRRRAIERLERLTGSSWSDFNTHDPGITILEQLCYALSDLSYRADYPLADLLCSEGEDAYNSIYSPAQLLPTAPVTLADLRKYIIDIAAVRNAWIDSADNSSAYFDRAARGVLITQTDDGAFKPNLSEISIRGLLRASVERADIIDGNAGDTRRQVAGRLHQSRGLGQDFQEIKVLERQPVGIEAVLEIDAVEDATTLLADIYRRIADYMSPAIPQHALTAMQQRGQQLDGIFEGPLLGRGFIDGGDLARAGRRTAVRVSDLIHQLTRVPGVAAVKYLRPRSGDGKLHAWALDVDADKAPWFNPPGDALDIQLEHNGVQIVDHTMQQAAVALFKRSRQAAPQESSAGIEQALRLPEGRNRSVGNYSSIMHQFPRVYGVGAAGLPQSASPERRATAKQLQAYLLFFDQLLGNQFAQLANLSALFSFHRETVDSYFSQMVQDDGDLDLDSLRVSSPDKHREWLHRRTEDPSSELGDAPGRRSNRFLDHLLARFGQQFHDSALLPEETDTADGLTPLARQARGKRAFLRDYPRIGRDRGIAFNCLEATGAENISGLERILACKLGIDYESNYESKDEKFYLVEHILLRPLPGDDRQQGPLLRDAAVRDPYSLQITLVFPDWPVRYQNRQLVEKMVREEAPAHLIVHILWKTKSQMLDFTAAHQLWLNRWRAYRHAELSGAVDHGMHSIPVRAARDRLIDLLAIGDSYPLTDLNVNADQLKVTYNTTAKIPIEHAQLGVAYQLCDPSGNPLGSGFKRQGTGATLIIETPPVVEDITYRIEVIKQSHLDKEFKPPRRFLSEGAPVKVGLDTGLEISFAGHEALALLDSTNSNPKPSDPRIVSYGEKDSIDVQVHKTQEGVEYALLLNGNAVKPGVTGDLKSITLPTGPINEDTTIQVQATKTFPEGTGRTTEIELLHATLSLKVRANPQAAVAAKAPVIAFGHDAAVIISATEENIRYRALIRRIEDTEFVRGDSSNQSIAPITVAGKPDVRVRQPGQAGTPFDGVDHIPAGYLPATAFMSGNGGAIELPLKALEEDSLVLIQAVKDHRLAADTQQTIASSVALNQAAAVLVQPDPARALTLSAVATGANTVTVAVSGGQPGVFYYFRATADGPEFPLPVYFHQRDRQYARQNKGIDQLGVEIDLAIIAGATGTTATDPAGAYPPEPIVEMKEAAVDSPLLVRAQKAQTGVETAMTNAVTITAAPTTG